MRLLTLFVLDTSSFIHRAYHASLGGEQYYTKEGTPCSAVLLFKRMVEKLQSEHQPDYMCAALDLPDPTWRLQLYADYKGTRREPIPDLLAQIPGCVQHLRELKMPAIGVPGFEADDVIGTIAETVPKANPDISVVIVTGDKDMTQLVSKPEVYVLNTNKGIIWDEVMVEKTFGVPPFQMVDYLSLVGDSSDNVPGAEGIGEKGAVMLLKRYGKVEEIIRNSMSIQHKTYRRAVQFSEKNILLSKKLVTIRRDVPLGMTPQELIARSEILW